MSQGTPAITWSNPDDIAYGTALNGTQLNATSSVPGNFTYDPDKELYWVQEMTSS